MIEEKYKQLQHREHIYKLPDTYIGSIEHTSQECFVLNEDETQMTKQTLEIVPGFFKIFDEILVNAIDHKQRDPSVRNIRVHLEHGLSEIVVQNDGSGIDVCVHADTQLYVPEMLFAHLLTSSNYREDEKRTTGGKNGYGATLASIFSEYFIVETVDATRQLKYTQKFSKNNQVIDPPKIVKCTTKPYTKITFMPDYPKFKLVEGITTDLYRFLVRRVYDVTAVTPSDVSVHLNGNRLKIKSMEKYIELFAPGQKIFFCEFPRWKIGLVLSPSREFHQTSFVNGIWTLKGGRHLDYVLNQVIDRVKNVLSRHPRTKNKVFKTSQIKDNLWLFVVSVIENPSFTSQTKEELTTKVSQFGSSVSIDESWVEKFMKNVSSEGDSLIERMVETLQMDANRSLKKTDGTKRSVLRGIPKLEDALHAGTRNSMACTLILTEGDSAKASVLSGLSALGSSARETYGVFPLRGKFINVRDTNLEKVSANEEVKQLKTILGLQQGKVYTLETLKELRYGSIALATDQDCLTYDTPLLVQNSEGHFDIKTVDSLTEDWIQGDGDIFYGNADFKIWSDQGWTNIVKIVKKRTTKRIFRILTHTGCIDVTEDHPLLTQENVSITPTDCSIGTGLKHFFPMFSENKIGIPDRLEQEALHDICSLASQAKIQYYRKKRKNTLVTLLNDIKNRQYYDLNQETWFDENEAYVMGLFQTDGTCGLYTWVQKNVKKKDRPRTYNINVTRYYWAISNTDLKKLEKSMEIMNRIYDLEFKIIEDRTHEKRGYCKAYKLIVNGGMKTKEFVDKYRSLFYDKHKSKRIPSCILNAPKNIRERFEQGIYDGDGSRLELEKRGTRSIAVFGKIGAQGLYFLYKSLGYDVSINTRESKPNVYTLTLTKGHQQADPVKIKKIIALGYTDQYVYDLETENHHLQAGIGQLIVHNCDASHIRGLILNFLHFYWPSLLQIDGFVKSLITPIVKGWYRNEQKSFYTLKDYEHFRRAHAHEKWNFKYYKGLGTSTATEFKEYFKNLASVTRVYKFDSDQPLVMAFSKSQASARKDWLKTYDPDDTLEYHHDNQILLTDFVHKDLKHFSNYDNLRSIPNAIDGLKPSQRKVLYGIFKKGKGEIKVAQLASFVSEQTQYHHGEVSLEQTIVGLAQDFVGKTNLPLLEAKGQFGTRLQGGADHAQSRYIYTDLRPHTNVVFMEVDEPLLQFLEEESRIIEPKQYYPILPLVLCTGAVGIGTGYSTSVPSFNPKELIDSLKRRNKGDTRAFERDWVPWYKGFRGKIEVANPEKTKFITQGVFTQQASTVRVTELPVGSWTQPYKEHLELLMSQGVITQYVDRSTDETVDIEISFSKVPDDIFSICSVLKLQSKLSLGNMYLYKTDSSLHKFESVNEILNYYYGIRLDIYVQRKAHLLKQLRKDTEIVQEQIQFIRYVMEQPMRVFQRPKTEIRKDLLKQGYREVDALLNMPIFWWTDEKLTELAQTIKRLQASIDSLQLRTPEQLWNADLEHLERLMN